jgi:hypothetical protein
MNRGEIKDLALVWLDDVDQGYYTDTIMDRFINQAQREVQKKLLKAGDDYYTICVETSTVANQRDYQLPTDFFQLMRIERITQGSGDTATTERIYPITRNEVDVAGYNTTGSAGQGLPFNYVINKNTFSLYPVPSSVVTLRLWYAPRVADMSLDADTPDVPADWHEYIAILAARDGFLRDDRSLGPIESKLLYYEKMLDETAESRSVDSPRMVVATPDGFGAY